VILHSHLFLFTSLLLLPRAPWIYSSFHRLFQPSRNCSLLTAVLMLLSIKERHETELNMLGPIPSVRQLTPPNSPSSSDHTMLPPIKTSWLEENLSKLTGKMSLDFIAPGSRSPSPQQNFPRTLPRLEILSAAAAIHRGSRPSSSFLPSIGTGAGLPHPAFTPQNSPQLLKLQPAQDEYYTSSSGGLPSPVWSNYSEPHPVQQRDNLHFNLGIRDRRPSDSTCSTEYDTRPPVYTSVGVRSTRVQKRSPRATRSIATSSRGERYPYDAEERFALVYLRREDFEKKLEWKDVMIRYSLLFPASHARRYRSKDGTQARGLPPYYPQREIQGLQCRLYRIRTDEELPKSRDAAGVGGIDTAKARAAIQDEMDTLHAMALRDGLSTSFVKRVKQLAMKGDLNDILAYSHSRL
jgi:hypothetical protein